MTAVPIREVMDFEAISKIVSDHYDLGELISAVRIYRGYINITNDIQILKNRQITNYILRIYREGIPEDKIRFEHELIKELRKRGFTLSPRLVETRYQSTCVRLFKQSPDGRKDLFIVVYHYLPGEDKYSWDDPMCTPAELSHAAGVLAAYHNTIYGWRDPAGWKEPSIIDRISHMKGMWKTCIESQRDSIFNRYLLKQFYRLIDGLDQVSEAIERPVYNTLPHLIVHGDFHPGNLKFQDGKVVGLFDFDWSMLDTRCFDVALALAYFCTAWGRKSDGDLLIDRVDVFLDGYQACARKMKPLGALSDIELHYIPQMFLAGILYICQWTISEYYATLPDPKEYVRYLKHSIRSIGWFEHHRNKLAEVAAGKRI